MPPQFLSKAEVGALLKVGRTKVNELLRLGEIESVRIGTSVRIPVEALDAYIERLREQAALAHAK